jgi:DNA-binding transcriptional ArsR family regulator
VAFPDYSGKPIYRKLIDLRQLSRLGIVLGVLIVFSALSTVLLGFQLANYSPWMPPQNTNSTSIPPPVNPVNRSLALWQGGSYVLAPVSWGLVLGAWLWRGRVRAEWSRLGLTEDLFRLLMKMRGSGTRASIMRALDTPKDRFQLSKDLGLDWTTIDYQVRVLLKYGLVAEDAAYGNVKMYKLTPVGELLLKALREMEKDEGAPTQ